MFTSSLQIRKRMRSKAPPDVTKQVMLELPDTGKEEPNRRKSVYLVTLPHPKTPTSSDGYPLVAPESLSQQAVLAKFLECCRYPDYVDARSLHMGYSVGVLKAGDFRELCQPDSTGVAHAHDHLPVLADRVFGFLPVKRALLKRHGLASHWSCTHDWYWSAIRYVVVPSPKKPLAALDPAPVLWAATAPHPPLETCCHEPLTAKAIQARRRKAETKAAEAGEDEPKVTELHVWPLVVENGFRNTPDDHTAHLKVIAYAKKHASKSMQVFLFKVRARLPGLIDDIWMWETVEETLERAASSRNQALRAAAATQCKCGGRWLTEVVKSFLANNIPIQELCRTVYTALEEGRSETVPVIVFGGAAGGEGKSLFLKGLASVVGIEHVFSTPQTGNFPLLGLVGKKIAFLDDWRFNEEVLPFSTQCLWYDGSPLPITRPQNQTGVSGHILYEGTAPIFATTKLADLEALYAAAQLDPRTGRPGNADASMIWRRLKVFAFNTKMRKPTGGKIPYCPRCFSELVLRQSGH